VAEVSVELFQWMTNCDSAARRPPPSKIRARARAHAHAKVSLAKQRLRPFLGRPPLIGSRWSRQPPGMGRAELRCGLIQAWMVCLDARQHTRFLAPNASAINILFPLTRDKRTGRNLSLDHRSRKSLFAWVSTWHISRKGENLSYILIFLKTPGSEDQRPAVFYPLRLRVFASPRFIFVIHPSCEFLPENAICPTAPKKTQKKFDAGKEVGFLKLSLKICPFIINALGSDGNPKLWSLVCAFAGARACTCS